MEYHKIKPNFLSAEQKLAKETILLDLNRQKFKWARVCDLEYRSELDKNVIRRSWESMR